MLRQQRVERTAAGFLQVDEGQRLPLIGQVRIRRDLGKQPAVLAAEFLGCDRPAPEYAEVQTLHVFPDDLFALRPSAVKKSIALANVLARGRIRQRLDVVTRSTGYGCWSGSGQRAH